MAGYGGVIAASAAACRAHGVTVERWSAFVSRGLLEVADPFELRLALEMLRARRFPLFAEVWSGCVVGVVQDQFSAKRIHACRLAEDGHYTCCTQNLRACGDSHDSPCKHILALVLGVVGNQRLAPDIALEWLRKSGNRVMWPDTGGTTAIFLRYKYAESGEVDWRPTETIPEDFYVM
jgi:hypothetical protein